MRRNKFKRNDQPSIRTDSRNVYLATLINPVDHKLYDVLSHVGAHAIITYPKPNDFYMQKDPQDKIIVLGRGWVDMDDQREIEDETYYRSHSPSGVAKKKAGLGLMLYSGLSLVAVYRTAAGIFSVTGDRSIEASNFWMSQVSRDLAEETTDVISGEFDSDIRIDEDMIDMCEVDCEASHVGHYPDYVNVTVEYETGVEIQYLSGERVAERGLVLAWNEDDDELDSLSYEDIPAKVLIGLDLSTTTDPALLINILERLETDESISDDELRRFVERLPGSLRGIDSQMIREILGQQKFDFDGVLAAAEQSMTANPQVKPDAAWKNYFGDLAIPIDESEFTE